MMVKKAEAIRRALNPDGVSVWAKDAIQFRRGQEVWVFCGRTVDGLDIQAKRCGAVVRFRIQ